MQHKHGIFFYSQLIPSNFIQPKVENIILDDQHKVQVEKFQ